MSAKIVGSTKARCFWSANQPQMTINERKKDLEKDHRRGKEKKVGTLGPRGTYSHRATRRLVGDSEIEFYDTVPEIADGIIDNEIDEGVVPIENSIEGSVNATLDVLTDYDLFITHEIVIGVEHALIAQSKDFETVASHPQALAQCRSYLRENHPGVEIKSVSSTARGVEIALEDRTVAAIAHPDLASGEAQVLQTRIQDSESNSTRFVVLGRQKKADPGTKTTIIVYPGDDYPGLLHDLLGVFKRRNINLSRIESRPSKHELGDYVFHIDFESSDRDVDKIVGELEEEVEWVKLLGSYERLEG